MTPRKKVLLSCGPKIFEGHAPARVQRRRRRYRRRRRQPHELLLRNDVSQAPKTEKSSVSPENFSDQGSHFLSPNSFRCPEGFGPIIRSIFRFFEAEIEVFRTSCFGPGVAWAASSRTNSCASTSGPAEALLPKFWFLLNSPSAHLIAPFFALNPDPAPPKLVGW